MWQISYPPVNKASQGNYFLPKSHKLAVFEEKTCKLFFNGFCDSLTLVSSTFFGYKHGLENNIRMQFNA